MAATPPSPDPRAQFRAGLRAGRPFAAAGFFVSLSFGVLAVDAGMPWWAAVLMSAIVFAGSAQFAAITIVTGGGSIAAALAAGAMANSRFLPMGVAFGPSLPGRWWWRALQGQPVVDASWAIANRGDGTFDRHLLFGSTAVQYVTWSAGTLVGALAGNAMGDPDDYGLDAMFPAFFLALVLSEIKSRETLGVALAGGALALTFVPLVPIGVPVLLGGLAALWGARRR